MHKALRFKLKYIDLFKKDKIEFNKISEDILGFGSLVSYSQEVMALNKAKIIVLCSNYKNFKVEDYKLEKCEIKLYEKIDEIPYIARMELDGFITQKTPVTQSNFVSTVISMATFSANFDSDFDTDSKEYIKYKKSILEMDIFNCLKLVSMILKDVEDSKKMWNRLFEDVSHDDEDFANAGGGRLSKFSIIRELKQTCESFNVNYSQSWQLPFSVHKTNSLEISTRDAVQRDLTIIKERKFKNRRGR